MKKCTRCDNLLCSVTATDELVRNSLCLTLTAKDWEALKPWFSGQLHSVHMGGE